MTVHKLDADPAHFGTEIVHADKDTVIRLLKSSPAVYHGVAARAFVLLGYSMARYDDLFDACVGSFQRVNGFEPTGKIDGTTHKAMVEALENLR